MWLSRQEVSVKTIQRLAAAEALVYSQVRTVASVFFNSRKEREMGRRHAPEKALKEQIPEDGRGV